MNIQERLIEILLSDNVSDNILENIEYILMIIPEIKYMIGFKHNHPHHHLDVFEHTLLAIENSPPDFEVRMALLLHDIGKPFSYQDDGKIRHFRGHVEASTKISNLILRRLNFEEKFIGNVLYLISNHDTIIDISNIDVSFSLIQKRLEVQYADAKAHAPDKVEMRVVILDRIKENLNQKYSIFV